MCWHVRRAIRPRSVQWVSEAGRPLPLVSLPPFLCFARDSGLRFVAVVATVASGRVFAALLACRMKPGYSGYRHRWATATEEQQTRPGPANHAQRSVGGARIFCDIPQGLRLTPGDCRLGPCSVAGLLSHRLPLLPGANRDPDTRQRQPSQGERFALGPAVAVRARRGDADAETGNGGR